MKKIFVAGAGLVARPLIKYLLDRPDFRVELADIEVGKALKIINGHPRGASLKLDIHDEVSLKKKIAEADLVVSMVPATFHPVLGNLCVELGKPMVTASYISPALRALDEKAKQKGVILLNEVGLDPGIDHMEAVRIIRRMKNAGGLVISFISYCGGLPAPEANTNPFGYKFSWSPKGVLLAGKNSARYLEDGRTVSIPADELFQNYKMVSISGLGEFEAYPNRDSLPYREAYGIPETRDLYRGTLRYPGWCLIMKKINELGLLEQKERDFSGMTYAGLMRELTHTALGADLKTSLSKILSVGFDSSTIRNLEWLGLLDERPLPAHQRTVLDVLTQLMFERLQYGEGERDMILLQHEFVVLWANGEKEKISSTLIDYGIPNGDSSMSRTVGLPVAICARNILEGKIALTGVRAPFDPEISEPILDELKSFGIEFKEVRARL